MHAAGRAKGISMASGTVVSTPVCTGVGLQIASREVSALDALSSRLSMLLCRSRASQLEEVQSLRKVGDCHPP